jgi:Flp pilus assembly pilin Flp
MRFLNDEAGLTTWITAVILLLVAVVLLWYIIVPTLTDSIRKIVACIQCALLSQGCTSCW